MANDDANRHRLRWTVYAAVLAATGAVALMSAWPALAGTTDPSLAAATACPTVGPSPQPTVARPQSPFPTGTGPQSPRPTVTQPQSPGPTVTQPQSPQPTVTRPQSPLPTVTGIPTVGPSPQPTVTGCPTVPPSPTFVPSPTVGPSRTVEPTPTVRPTAVAVPDLRGDTEAQAILVLHTAGLSLGSVGTVVDNTCEFINEVVSQDPRAGAVAAAGSTVSITIGARPTHPCP